MDSTEVVSVLNIPATERIDRFTVFWINWEPGRGQVTIICQGSAWTAYFGAMSGDSIQKFFRRADLGYLVNKLVDRQWQKCSKKLESHLSRVVEVVKSELAEAEGKVAHESR